MKYNRSTLDCSMQCKTHAAHIHESKIEQLICMAPSMGVVEFAKPCLEERKRRERMGEGRRRKERTGEER